MPRALKCECGECRTCRHRDYMRAYDQQPERIVKKREAARAYREANLEVVREKDRIRNRSEERKAAKRERQRGKPQTEAKRRWTSENRDRVAEAARRWKRGNREKINAQGLLAYHVRVGNVERLPCEVCGDPKSEGHHEDYSRPLDVRWLCRRHHAEVHRMEEAHAA